MVRSRRETGTIRCNEQRPNATTYKDGLAARNNNNIWTWCNRLTQTVEQMNPIVNQLFIIIIFWQSQSIRTHDIRPSSSFSVAVHMYFAPKHLLPLNANFFALFTNIKQLMNMHRAGEHTIEWQSNVESISVWMPFSFLFLKLNNNKWNRSTGNGDQWKMANHF